MPKRYRQLDSGLAVPAPEVWIPREPWRQRSLIEPWRWMSRRRCCCEAGDVACDKCSGSGNNAPNQFQVVIAGLTDSLCGGTLCSDMNDTFILSSISTCLWEYAFDCIICATNWASNRIQLLISKIDLTYYLQVYLNIDSVLSCGTTYGIGYLFMFEKTKATPFNCLALDGTGDGSLSWVGTVCNGASATCLVTAL